MLKQLILAAALALFAVPASAQKANAPATKPSRATMSFVKNALVGSKFAVESSRLAAQKAQNPDVKNFAQRLADDYSRRSEELKQIIQQAGLMTADPALDSRRAAVMRRLQTMPAGQKFDRAYIDAQATAHSRAISMFRRYARSGDNPELKQFAATTLSVVEENLKQIKGLRSVKTSRTEKQG